MFKIKCETQFDMAHCLDGYEGKCANIHGHRYRLIAVFAANNVHENGQLCGMLDDFSVIKKTLNSIAETFDHKLILENNANGKQLKNALQQHAVVLKNYRPTAEMMAKDIFMELKNAGLPVYEVELFETPTNSCIYNEVPYV